ncbi:unnamed protein product (macronuclear) [Paramecium tetraurelia]|uniref:Uncharacterized protein n=1 Tax=Paramecium tetraurelia TaxID=5888 RepID=A0CXM3_PARTE|nr:uncharacterized protein GSPATT00011172001 [Paramecium tetraurelia]CAK75540.1 unnamed protein product [Paramecium tetraurelia]|eukprot:XP_001442937.1 hypothetical protein (macronuclear) [Paramecium tetraurelia strain d4-2]
MNKNQIQNANIRKPSNTYLKTEFNNTSQIKDNRFTTEPSPKKCNKENIVKASYLKATLSNHLIKQDRNITPNLPKSSVISLFLKQQQEEQQVESKGSICQAHKKKYKYEVNEQLMCSRCVVDYAILSGLPIRYYEIEKKMLTFGQEEDHDEFYQFTQNTTKELQYIQNIQTQANGIIKKKELKDFVLKVGDVISQNMQFLKLIQQHQIQFDNPKQKTHKILEELQMQSKQIIDDILDKQKAKSQGLLINDAPQQINLASFKSVVSQQINDLQNIKKDILENVENIITQMDVAPFKIIINKYNEKLRSFENTLFEIQEQYKQFPKQNEDQGYTKKMRELNFQKKLQKIFTELMENPIQKSLLLADQINNNTKFIQLLQKVNTNQNTNTIFYQSILKDINSDEKPKQIRPKLRQQE